MPVFDEVSLKKEYENYSEKRNGYLQDIEQLVIDSKISLEGNTFYHNHSLNLYPDLYTKQLNLFWCGKQATTRICEIGFNAGHSTMVMLLGREKIPLQYTIFDIGQHAYVKPCLKYIESKFPHITFEYVEGDSTVTMPKWVETNEAHVGLYDVVHVDGGHSEHCISNDMKNADILVRNGGIVIVDDTQIYEINTYVQYYLSTGKYREIDALKTSGYPHRVLQKIRSDTNEWAAPPDVTLATACYDLTPYFANARSLNETLVAMEALLEEQCFLCIFCDKNTVDHIKSIRNERFGLAYLTHYVVLPLEKIWTYNYVEKVRANRLVYYPTNDDRTCVETHLIQCNKFDFVLETMKLDPFSTRRFGWIDANIGVNSKKICEKYRKNMLSDVLHSVTDSFHIQVLNVEDKSFLETENLREYYRRYRWIVCGCLFTTGRKIGIPILKRLKELFIQTTMLGYGHAEEPLFLGVLDEFYESIERSYGDYYNIVNNFKRHTRGFLYIHNTILQRYLQFEYFREGYDCSKKLIRDFEVGDASDALQFHIHYKHLIFASKYKADCVEEIIQTIKQHIKSGKYMEEFKKGEATYVNMFPSLRTDG